MASARWFKPWLGVNFSKRNNTMTHIAGTPLSRRTFLRAAGPTLALPFRDAMRPVFGALAEVSAVPRRMVAIEAPCLEVTV